MTKTLFHQDAYLREHQAKVVKVDGVKVLLDETIFFPQTSTEPGDVGKMNDNKVIGLKKEKETGDIWHILKKPPVFGESAVVNLQIDWDKRYKAMRLHSALHHWASVFDSLFEERAVAGVVKSDSAYLVFKQELSDDKIQKALNQANKDIENGLDIKTYDDKNREGFRWCQVGFYNPIPCGGVHVKNTKEIGKLTLKEKVMDAGKQKLVMEVE